MFSYFSLGFVPTSELFRGIPDEDEAPTHPYHERYKGFNHSESRLPGNDGSYPMPIAYAAASDSRLLDAIPPDLVDDMMELLSDYMLSHTKFNTSQACLMAFFEQWRTNRQVSEDFRRVPVFETLRLVTHKKP